MEKNKKVAYFSMEFAISDDLQNYAGGLGVLAGDIIHSMADLKAPSIGVSIIYHWNDDLNKGIDPNKKLEDTKKTVTIKIENRDVIIKIYKKNIRGIGGYQVPILFLSSHHPENKPWDRDLTKELYSINWYTRLCQEYILGVAGVLALQETGNNGIDYYHMNEGHAAPLTLQILQQNNHDIQGTKNKCTFTTHTPISAGHDYFDYNLVHKTLVNFLPFNIKSLAGEKNLGMTELALNLSGKANSVSEKHCEICKQMFKNQSFENITNGIHHIRWASENFSKLFDKTLKNWQKNPETFEKAIEKIPNKALKKSKEMEKAKLIEWINSNNIFFPFKTLRNDDLFDSKTLTLVFARRFVEYKRPDLIFKNINKLRDIGYKKIQLIFSAHCGPGNQFCNDMKKTLFERAKELRGQIKIAVTDDYNMEIAKKLVSGTDIWLNNPIAPLEASGTSGMKAALNGSINLSIKDGWWIEGLKMRPESGFGFGQDHNIHFHYNNHFEDAEELYQELSKAIDIYYEKPKKWLDMMKASISLISHFNTERVVKEYYKKMWE